ncbi:MAG: hypothetical protein ABGY96_14335 [bacterium]|nr:hypothetical protein [Gammaproteobacteria bacterium]
MKNTLIIASIILTLFSAPTFAKKKVKPENLTDRALCVEKYTLEGKANWTGRGIGGLFAASLNNKTAKRL